VLNQQWATYRQRRSQPPSFDFPAITFRPSFGDSYPADVTEGRRLLPPFWSSDTSHPVSVFLSRIISRRHVIKFHLYCWLCLRSDRILWPINGSSRMIEIILFYYWNILVSVWRNFESWESGKLIRTSGRVNLLNERIKVHLQILVRIMRWREYLRAERCLETFSGLSVRRPRRGLGIASQLRDCLLLDTYLADGTAIWHERRIDSYSGQPRICWFKLRLHRRLQLGIARNSTGRNIQRCYVYSDALTLRREHQFSYFRTPFWNSRVSLYRMMM